MARLEAEENGDAGRAREWIARAATAARDPVWTADRVILDSWSPVSPVTGALDAVAWRSPVSGPECDEASLAADLKDLLAGDAGGSMDVTDTRTIDAELAKSGDGRSGGDQASGRTLAHAPDDPGAEGEALVPEIRTSRKSRPS
jgi:HemY protein